MSNIDLNLCNDNKIIRFSSFYAGGEKGYYYLKQRVPFDDIYTITTDLNTNVSFYSLGGDLIANCPSNSTISIKLTKDSIINTVVSSNNLSSVYFYVSLKENESLLPYEPLEFIDATLLLANDKSNMTEAPGALIEYVKRPGGLYINSNNPEKLFDDIMHVGITRNDISNKEVFFTFEHNNSVNYPFYYGNQVINNGKEDIYVTVKNLGLHLSGKGCWLGEKEWIEFYNKDFKVRNFDEYTEGQKNTFAALYGFANDYEPKNYQPITYCIPKGKHIYVMGGTTVDAYQNINVFDTADKAVEGGCSNGAVLFEVCGEGAEGVFYAYTDPKKIDIDNKTLMGYVVSHNNHPYGRTYGGHDDCHGVVDAKITFEFSDNVKMGYLPVTFTNSYDEKVCEKSSEPFAKINSIPHLQENIDHWVTHINPQQYHDAVGTDMAAYKTVDSKGNPLCIDADIFDGTGELANIGNWMIDYMEYFTFVNHGNKARKVTVSITHRGAIAVLLRDGAGKYIEGSSEYAIHSDETTHGDPILDGFKYTVEVPPKGFVQFIIEYNLLANSYGHLEHKVWLD